MVTKSEQSRIGKSNVNRSKAHERRVSKLLYEWSGCEFRRRRVQGRDSTVLERESTSDVIPVSGNVIFAIEAKCGKMTHLDGLLMNPEKNIITEWWHQTCYDTELLVKKFERDFYPMMFCKPHPNFDWVCVSLRAFYNYLQPKDGESRERFEKIVSYENKHLPWFPHFLFDYYQVAGPIEHDVLHSKRNVMMIGLDLSPMVICRWKDFAANVDPKSIFIEE